MDPSTEVLFLLVHYYNEKDLFRFIREELQMLSYVKWKAVVVDNGSEDPKSLQKNLSEHKNVIYLNPDENLGYLNGAAAGLDYYKSIYGNITPWIIVANTDIKIVKKDFLEILFSLQKQLDMVGPSIVSSSSGAQLNPFLLTRIKKSKLKFLLIVFSFYPLYLVYQLLSIVKSRLVNSKNKLNLSSSVIYAMHGSFMIFKKSFFDKGGKLHYPSFLYEEEIYVAEQARQLNLIIMFEPSIELIHYEHSTTGTIKSIKQFRFIRNSIKYIINNFFNE